MAGKSLSFGMSGSRRHALTSPLPLVQPDELRHSCGLFGIAGHADAAELSYLGLYAQQHRGQESAGIATADGRSLKRHVGMGLVTDAIGEADLAVLRNPLAIGHVRYSTTGSCQAANAQPLLATTGAGPVAICHNGNLTNAAGIRGLYEQNGHIFTTTSDTEVVLHLLADPRFRSQPDPLAAVLATLTGSFCLLLLHLDRVEAVRDASGNRPLCLGRLGSAWVVASETNALDLIDAEFVRNVEPGEIVTLAAGSPPQSRRYVPQQPTRCAQCIFELVYFADPASYVFGESVHEVRRSFGRALAQQAPVDGDLVIAVPNCARCAALGYHEQSGLPIGRGFTTNHYVGRSFIQPTQAIRDLTVRLKLNPIRSSVEGRRLVVVEDSVVRGTTTRMKMQSLRNAGAREIHLRVASPPIHHPCYYGIDFPRSSELIANARTIEQIRDYLGVDSLEYLELDRMLACLPHSRQEYCHACFSGDYPLPVDNGFRKDVFERSAVSSA